MSDEKPLRADSDAGQGCPCPDACRDDTPDEPAGRTPPRKSKPAVVARYGLMGQIGAFRCTGGALPAPGSKVVVRTERGVELATVIARVCDDDGPFNVAADRLDTFVKSCGSDYPFRRNGKLLRPANQQDLIDHRHLEGSARDESAFCRREIEQLGLEMKLVSVEHLLGGERIIFYFTAESRVDFRELVRRLASQYHTRIEMRQLGARDEARLKGDYERCGRECCCRAFLKDLRPVSMRMAKTQKATLDPAKISGRCGRLMCCLRYEDAGYKDLRGRLPRRNTWVRSGDAHARVVETQILTQLVKLARPDGTFVVVANEEIIERDAEPPTGRKDAEDNQRRRGATQVSAKAQARQQPTEKPAGPAPQGEMPAKAAGDSSGDEGGAKRKKRRSGRRRKGRSKGKAQKGDVHGSGNQGGAKKKKRRRRRSRKKSDGKDKRG
ncbi:MAG: PSP1 domain-containing protein [Planctomycetota bacterium]